MATSLNTQNSCYTEIPQFSVTAKSLLLNQKPFITAISNFNLPTRTKNMAKEIIIKNVNSDGYINVGPDFYFLTKLWAGEMLLVVYTESSPNTIDYYEKINPSNYLIQNLNPGFSFANNGFNEYEVKKIFTNRTFSTSTFTINQNFQDLFGNEWGGSLNDELIVSYNLKVIEKRKNSSTNARFEIIEGVISWDGSANVQSSSSVITPGVLTISVGAASLGLEVDITPDNTIDTIWDVVLKATLIRNQAF